MTILSPGWAWDGRACMPSLGTSARYSCARSGVCRTEGRISREGDPLPQEILDSTGCFLRFAVKSATEKGSAPDVFSLCVAPLVNDAEVRRFLRRAVRGGTALVERRFLDGISAGDIPGTFR